MPATRHHLCHSQCWWHLFCPTDGSVSGKFLVMAQKSTHEWFFVPFIMGTGPSPGIFNVSEVCFLIVSLVPVNARGSSSFFHIWRICSNWNESIIISLCPHFQRSEIHMRFTYVSARILRMVSILLKSLLGKCEWEATLKCWWQCIQNQSMLPDDG